MAIKHLRAVEDFFKKNSDNSYTKTQVQRQLKKNYNIVLECLAYLVEHGIIEKNDKKYKLKTSGGENGK